MPIFIAAGAQDPTVPYDRAEHAAELLRRAGADVEFHEYAGGHKLPAEGIKDLRAWFNARA
jgi:phospholipase/carboxylesterase